MAVSECDFFFLAGGGGGGGQRHRGREQGHRGYSDYYLPLKAYKVMGNIVMRTETIANEIFSCLVLACTCSKLCVQH